VLALLTLFLCLNYCSTGTLDMALDVSDFAVSIVWFGRAGGFAMSFYDLIRVCAVFVLLFDAGVEIAAPT